jgi:hypothetical protein
VDVGRWEQPPDRSVPQSQSSVLVAAGASSLGGRLLQPDVSNGRAEWESGSDLVVIPGALSDLDARPTARSAELSVRLGELAREREEARAEADRLREENEALRSELEYRSVEVERLQGLAERLLVVRAKCDQLFAERVWMERETSALQTRLTEIQVTLIGVEADLDEQRSHHETERHRWEKQAESHRPIAREARALGIKVAKLRALNDQTRLERDQAVGLVEVLDRRVDTLGARCARLSAYLDEAQTERRVADQAYQAEIDRLDAALRAALEETDSGLA